MNIVMDILIRELTRRELLIKNFDEFITMKESYRKYYPNSDIDGMADSKQRGLDQAMNENIEINKAIVILKKEMNI